MQIIQSRRDFLASLSAAGAAGVLGARASLADEAPPEVTTIRIRREPFEHLRCARVPRRGTAAAEGFTDVRYLHRTSAPEAQRRRARRDRFQPWSSRQTASCRLDAGVPITVLAGVHSGCFELFAQEPIRTISDLKGKKSASPDSTRAGTCS